MGGRGANSSKGSAATYEDYTPYKRGQITNFEAGTIYRANKEGHIKVLPETTRLLYAEKDAYIRYATERYNQDARFYDRIYRATSAIQNSDFKRAQKLLTDVEKDFIKRASKKSPFYKYKK